jgi:hypothetical protein
MNKWEAWWDSLSPSTQEYLKAQPLWHDNDMWKAGMVGLVIGFILGVIL